MNHQGRKFLWATVLGAGALAMSPAQAAGHAGERAVIGIGYWIAAQGNQALRDIREQMKQELVDHVKPLVPQPRRDSTVPPKPAHER
jgi:hypothetical protein